MALFKEVEEVIAIKEDIVLNTNNPSFESVTSMDHIIKQIAGYKWTVDYFNVVSDLVDFQSTVDFSLDLAITEYMKIKDLVLILDTPIDNSRPSDVSGSGVIDAGIKPKNGDIFLAKLIDGGLGLFTITGVLKEVYNLKDIYKIEFKLYYIARSSSDEFLLKLVEKTIDTLYYNKEYLTTSDKQVYTSKEKSERTTSLDMLTLLINFYTSNIITLNTKYTISYIDGYHAINDSCIESFVCDVIGIMSLPDKLTMYNLLPNDTYTILQMLTDNINKVMISKYTSKVNSSTYNSNPYLKSVYWSGLYDIIIPVKRPIEGVEEINVTNNIYYPYVSNLHYIFNSIFYELLFGTIIYDDTVIITKIEKIVLDMLLNTPIKLADIESVMNALLTSSDLVEQYYYIPILIHAVKYVIYNNANGFI